MSRSTITFALDLRIWGCSYGFLTDNANKEPSALISERQVALEWSMTMWDDPTILERSFISTGNEDYHQPPDYWALPWVHGNREQLEPRSQPS